MDLDGLFGLVLLVIALLAMSATQSTSGDYIEPDWRV